MKVLKIFISLIFIVGIIPPVVSEIFYFGEHSVVLAPLSILCALTGTGMMFGFSNFRTRPKNIGNFDKDGVKPDINQTWMIFFISCIFNLLFANLCGF